MATAYPTSSSPIYVSNTVSVLLGNGNGTFQAQQTFATGIDPFSVAIGDVNGDGKADIVVANSGSNTVSVLLGNGNGTFQTAATFAAGIDPIAVAVGDLNGDGKLDIVVANEGSNTVSVLLNSANGNFTGQAYTIVNPAVPTHFVVSAAPTTITARHRRGLDCDRRGPVQRNVLCLHGHRALLDHRRGFGCVAARGLHFCAR